MTIQYHQLSEADYRTKRYNTLLQLEEGGVVSLTAYRDSAGYPTIGVGFKIDSNWGAILTTMGFDMSAPEGSAERTYIKLIEALIPTDSKFTASQMETLKSQLDTLMAARAADNNVVSAIPGKAKPTTFSFVDAAEVEATFQVIADDRETRILNKWLATKGLTVPDSNERVALLSLVYNNIIGFNQDGTVKSPHLLDDLLTGNRLAAWYEISYHTNGDGIHANRRYQEAYQFGLWDAGGPTQTELQNFETFLSSNDPYSTISVLQNMRNYEADYPPSNAGISTIDDYINGTPALKNYFVNKYAPGATIDGNMLLGTELDNNVTDANMVLTKYGIKSGYLLSTDRNDLILGQGGNDTIAGGGGNDVMIGGAGNDTIYGGTGNDVMIGGQGIDTYIVEGNDRIIDSDDKGIVRDKNGHEIAGIFIKQADRTYQWTNNTQVTATKNSPLTLYLPDGSTVVIENQANNGDFGIHLLDTPTEPQITNTIVGDLAPMDIDPITAGIQTGYDALGNLITGPNSEPNRADYLYDSAGNDRIEGRGGNDVINADKGGNDYLDGGLGDDIIQAGDGSDVLYGVGSIML